MLFTPKQNTFFREADKRWNIKDGATRSGKTYMDLFLIPKRVTALKGRPGLCVILGNTLATIRRNIAEPMQSLWGSGLVSDIKSDGTIYIFGEKCCCLGAGESTQTDRLRGCSIKYCYCDEAATYSETVFNMLKSRLDRPYSLCDMTCNPEGPAHWLYKFITSQSTDIYRQNYTIEDNPTLSDIFVSNLKKEYAGTVFYDRYILGKWVRGEGLIYDTFSEKNITEEKKRGRCSFIGIDYGTHNPTVFLRFVSEGGKIWVTDEYYYSAEKEGRQKTDREYVADLKRFADSFYVPAVIDPSAASFAEECRRNGFNAVRADNRVLDGIRRVCTAFADKTLMIHKDCKNLIGELYSYSWDTDGTEDRPVKENDHACDALRYGIMYAKNRYTIMTM